MTMTCDFGKLGKKVNVGDGVDSFYIEDGHKRMVFTTDGQYIYTYNYVHPTWK